MKKLRIFAAVAVSRLVRWALRVTGRGGTALPGKIALKIYPQLLAQLARNVKTVVITGTNGKTTSSRMIEQAFIDKGLSYFANRSGANLIQGITSDFADNATLFGKNKKEFAIIECDEAACKRVLDCIKPQCVLVTNIFRDQVDRFTELTQALDGIKAGLAATPETVMCLNADCALTSSLAAELPNPRVFFGVSVPIYKTEVTERSEATQCLFCKTELEYDLRTYAHLGAFRCPECGYAHQTPEVAVTEILELTAENSTVRLNVFGNELTALVNLPAGYNIYNAAGCAAALSQMGFSPEEAAAAVGHFECGFGRMESFRKDDADIRMILVKNPAGCNQVISFLCELDEPALFCVCINDNIADGTDISWIWDAEFEKLCAMEDRLLGVLVSGKRRADMRERLLSAGLPEEKMRVIEDADELIAAMTEKGGRVFVMPTYTAMLDLRARLSRATGGSEFWE